MQRLQKRLFQFRRRKSCWLYTVFLSWCGQLLYIFQLSYRSGMAAEFPYLPLLIFFHLTFVTDLVIMLVRLMGPADGW